ncbi:MAG: sulfatase-like hydrolase/transferase [Acidobacteriota bacterium]
MNRRQFMIVAGGAAATGAAAAPAARPNILLLFPDQLRHDWVEPNSPFPVRTPNLKRLATEGARFTTAVSPAPVCAPARACLAAGKEYDRCRVASNAVNYPLDQTTVYGLLRNSGYHVLGCGKFDLHKPVIDWGLDGKRLIREWGFSDGIDNEGKQDAIRAYEEAGKPTGPYMAYLERRGLAKVHAADFRKRRGNATFPTPLPDDAYCDNWIARNGLELLKSAPKDKPWFLQVNFNGPHAPWDVTANMQKGWREVQFPQPNQGQGLTPDQFNAVRQNYSAMVENIDRWVGVFLENLKQRGESGNTLIAFASDHGEMLGDHNAWGKSKPYHPSVGVPLVCWGPGVKKGLTSKTPATTMDLTATFLDYAGVSVPRDMDSRSLRPFLEGRTGKGRDYVLSGLDSWRMVIQDRYKFIRGFGPAPLLFDLVNDPLENENVAGANAGLTARLNRILETATKKGSVAGFVGECHRATSPC